MTQTATRDHHAVSEHPAQGTMLDLSGQYLNPTWVDPNQDLFLPANPLHYEAHQLQVLLALLSKQAQNKPAQFSAQGYITVLEKYTAICKQITEKGSADHDDDEERLDERKLAAGRHEGTTPPLGNRDASSVGVGISTDNPLAG